MKATLQSIAYSCLLSILSLSLGCTAAGVKPVVHTVPYQSDLACAADSDDCPWVRIEEQAKRSALINCLLAGANILHKDTSNPDVKEEPSLVAPDSPYDGYERRISQGDGTPCGSHKAACSMSSREDNKLTWAGCGSEPLANVTLRGGKDLANADLLADSAVVTGSLAVSTDTFQLPEGLDGPDQFYRFTLAEPTVIEAAVGVNSSDWSKKKGHLTPWQPGIFLLAADGRKISGGHVWRAGVTYLLPLTLDPGTYYLVADSSQREFTRGDGLYRLYLGLNMNHMGPVHPQ